MEPLTSGDPGEIAGYRLHARLGSGGMGRVYLAFTPGGRPVALKVVRPELGDDVDFRNRFRQEVEAARKVHGLYTAQVLDADTAAIPPWLVTAYVPGPSLHQAVSDHGPMPVETVLMLVAGVAEALQAIHAAGVVHRDLKPSNVLLAHDGPRVIDFGIARAAEATALTRSGIRVGSPQFMAPEQVEGLPVSPAIDVFALGSLAAYAVLGRPLFGEGTDVAVLYRVMHEDADLAGCPPQLRGVIERCLVKQPTARAGPAEILRLCRAQTAGKTHQIAQPWLPPAVAAALAEHAPPPPTATALPAAMHLNQVPPQATPGAGTAVLPADGPGRHGRGRFSRTTVTGGVLVLVITAALIGALTFPRNGPAPTPGPSGGTLPTPTGTPLRPTAPHSDPTPSSTRDPCVVGIWGGVIGQVPGVINNDHVLFTTHGWSEIFRANGTAVDNFGKRLTYTAHDHGETWTQVDAGRSGFDWETQNGTLLLSHVRTRGTQTLYENGVYNNQAPLALNTDPEHYTCSGHTLRMYAPDGSSLELRRKAQPTRTPLGS